MKTSANQNQSYTFHVTGMHCKACVLLTQGELLEHPLVTTAHSNLKTHRVTVQGNFGEMAPEVVARELSQLLTKHGYQLSVEPPKKVRDWKDFRYAVPLAALFIGGFVFLQELGLVNLIEAEQVSLGTAFFIGIIASLSSCLAVVGGLVLSVSASFAKSGDSTRPQILFHLGRLLAFFFLGGAIGAVGASFAITPSMTFVLSVMTGVIMLILGLNLLDVFSWTGRFQLTLPTFFSAHALRLTKMNHRLTPFLLGIITFFLPCGFTQSMQIYTLSTGSFLSGALTMTAFSLGTLPILALVSFSSLGLQTSASRGIFFKTAGLLVIALACFLVINSFVAFGLLPPVFSV